MTGAGRTLGIMGVGALVLMVVCLWIALIGRSGDWSPFALTIMGAAAGWCAGVATIILAYALGDDEVEG